MPKPKPKSKPKSGNGPDNPHIPDHVSGLTKAQRQAAECAISLMRQGPLAYISKEHRLERRNWSPYEYIRMSLPDIGTVEVHVETGAIYAEDAEPEEKARKQRMARLRA